MKPILIEDRFILQKKIGKIDRLGEVYEVANIVGDNIVFRHGVTKVAIGVVPIDEVDKYFVREDSKRTWTEWAMLNVMEHEVFYRTNGKKVQVKDIDNIRAETTCCDGDDWNLRFGIWVAYMRYCIKKLKLEEQACCYLIDKNAERASKLRSEISEMQHTLKMAINDRYKEF